MRKLKNREQREIMGATVKYLKDVKGLSFEKIKDSLGYADKSTPWKYYHRQSNYIPSKKQLDSIKVYVDKVLGGVSLPNREEEATDDLF